MGIQKDLQKIKEFIAEKEDNKVEKKFRFPFGKKVGRSQKKKNYVTVLILNENGVYDFKKYQINEQTILHDLVPRLATTAHVMFNKKGNPMVILPNWSVEPFSPKQHFEKSLKNGSNKKGYQILMNKMKSETVDAKKKMGNTVKWIIAIVIAAIIGYALLTGGAT